LVELSEPPSGISAAIVCSIRQAFLDVLGQADEVRDHGMVDVALVSIVVMGRRRDAVVRCMPHKRALLDHSFRCAWLLVRQAMVPYKYGPVCR
jgi:hypothetical protein